MEVLVLIDVLEDIIEGGIRIPFSGWSIVKTKELINMVQELRLKQPDEIKHAKGIKEERDRHAIKVIDDSVQRINSLIENLLSFSRLSKEDIKPVKLNALVNNIIQLEKKNLKEKHVEISVDISSDLEFKSNDEILKMSILNLINNSLDSFVDKGSKEHKNSITVKGYKQLNNVIIIKLSDYGSGI